MSYSRSRKSVVVALGLAVLLSTVASPQNKKSDEPKKKKEATSFSVLDSSEAQWGRRSINDSIYRGYTVNAVYFERGRQRLPDSFKMYKPTPIGAENVVQTGQEQGSPTTIKVNGKEQKLQDE